MSQVYGIACLDCRVRAPEVGSFGLIGYPSLSSAERAGMANFGFIYETFKDISLLTAELERIRLFLERHQGHKVLLLSDATAAVGMGEAGADLPPHRFPEEDPVPQGAEPWRRAHFRVSCRGCGKEYLSQQAEWIVPFDLHILPEGAVRKFLQRSGVVSRSILHAAPLRNWGELSSFLDYHFGDELTVSLEPAHSS